MRIESSNLNLQGSSFNSTFKSQSVNLTLSSQTELAAGSGSGEMVSTSITTQDALSISNVEVVGTNAIVKDSCSLPANLQDKYVMRLKLLEQFLSKMTGHRVRLQTPMTQSGNRIYDSRGNAITKLFSSSPLRSNHLLNPKGFARLETAGLSLTTTTNIVERSRVSFSAQGVVNTSDGRSINLDLAFNIDRQIVQSSQTSIQVQSGRFADPLVINFDGGLANFTERTMSFDVDLDGVADEVNQLSANSGYLAIDKNGNGVIDDGSELFGPKTNQGYAELAEYDEDGNGWIDEGDSIFSKLKIWYHDENGESHLEAIANKEIGAIYLGHVNTQMDMYSGTDIAGKLRQSGFVLLENGESRVMQELDLKI